MKTFSLFTTRQPIQILKKVWLLFFLSLITSHAVSNSRAEHTTSYRGRATTSFISYHQLKTWSLLSEVLKKVWPLFFLSLITSHAISTSRAEHTTSYRGKATTSFISYHQLKYWSLLSKDNQSKSWEKMWAKKLKLFVNGQFSCCWN